jgi:hypothetical protein
MTTGVTTPQPNKTRKGLRVGLALAVLCVGAAVTSASCADPEASFYVAFVSDTVAPTCSNDGLAEVTCGTLPAPFARMYTCNNCQGELFSYVFPCFALRTGLETSLSSSRFAERRTILLESVDVTLGGVKQHLPVSGALDPGTGDLDVEIPIAGADNLQSVLNAGTASGSIVVHGRTTGGHDLDTPEFRFTVSVQGVQNTDCK